MGADYPALQGGGYAGLPLTHAGLWAVIAAFSGAWLPVVSLLGLRIASAFLCGALVLRKQLARPQLLRAPSPRDSVLVCGLGYALYWKDRLLGRDRVLTIGADGRIVA